MGFPHWQKKLERSFFSSDLQVRKRSFFGLACLSFGLFCFIHLIEKLSHPPKRAQGLAGALFTTETLGEIHLLFFSLGRFTLELLPPSSPPSKNPPGVLYHAEVEITLACQHPEDFLFLKEHQTELSNQVTSVLTPISQEELLSQEGKKKLKHRLMKRLNNWIQKPVVQDVLFTQLAIN